MDMYRKTIHYIRLREDLAILGVLILESNLSVTSLD